VPTGLPGPVRRWTDDIAYACLLFCEFMINIASMFERLSTALRCLKDAAVMNWFTRRE
jgi:hypothetical protein